MSEEPKKTKEKCKLIIIGAGMAGLSAANFLIQNGCKDFKILEARNRIGGRIISIDMGNEKIELGANWIHGILGNPIFEVAMSNGLIPIVNIPKPHKVIAATEDGQQVPFTILQEIYEAYVCFLRRCEEYFLCQYIPPPDILSVGEHISLERQLYLNSVKDKNEKHLKELIFKCLLKRETCITGCHSMNEIDLLELGSYQELQGGNIVLPTGYSSILDPLSRDIPPEKIIKNLPVKLIHWKRKKNQVANGSAMTASSASIDLQTIEEEEAACESDDSDKTVTDEPIAKTETSLDLYSNVKIECDNGQIFYCDHVICTIPLGVLKEKSTTLFNPPLPDYKIEAIDNLLFGTVDKIYLEYDRPFLHTEISEIMLLWDSNENDDYDLEECSDDYIKENWYKKIYSFAKINETLLLGWISGKEAEYMETLDHTVISDKCTEILRKFLKDPYIPQPKRCVCTSWMKQPYSRGSYTSMAIGASQEDIENIALPLYSNPHQSKPSILFAGEHTHTNFYSTVHGAYLSGRTAAKIILTPDSPQEIVMESDDTDLSAWIQGMSLE